MGSQTPSRASTTTWCYTVAEIVLKIFPELSVRHDETDRTGGMVGATFRFRMEPHQVLLLFHLKPKRVVGLPRMPPAGSASTSGQHSPRSRLTA